jgi:hypothetical protein
MAGGGIMSKVQQVANANKNQSIELARIDQRYRTFRTLIRTCGVVLGVYFGVYALAPFAGKETAISLALNFLADIKFVVSITLAGAAAVWAIVERRLRERKTQYLQDRVKQLETLIDQNRSSSGLTRTGKTNPRDRRS